MLIAIPSDSGAGLDAKVSEHFGHCDSFTLVEVEDGEIGTVSVLENGDHEEGGCLAPVQLLKDKGVEILLAGGMGKGPLSGFQQVDIAVHFKENAENVLEAVELFLSGGCRAFGEGETCGSGCGGHHHDEPVKREPIVGRADVQEGRVVTLEYDLKDSEGNLFDSSKRTGPMMYLHGGGQILPLLESAITGLEPGAQKVVEIPCAEAFGERDEERVVEVPREQLPEDAEAGGMVMAQDQSGRRFPLTVLELGETTARLDGNHLLAGKDVVFDIKVITVEQATEEELTHGHVH
ncbi:MAG: hypothetical protein GY906_36260 [bacterium]|nr:hypothetical protein [bacterium]